MTAATTKDDMQRRAERWLERDPDPATRRELNDLLAKGSVDDLAARFSGRLQFGTAGLRGIVGAGPMRMNRLVVRETSAGLAAHLLASVPDAAGRGVVIAFDARPDSRQFAEDTASVLLGAGLRVYLAAEPQPTPVGAFAVLELGAAAGVVVTASHNPPEYNGYKVYWENGAQIVPPQDSGISACIDAASAAEIPWQPLDDARRDGRLRILGEDLVAEYRRRVAAGLRHDDERPRQPVGVAYTALHGVGAAIAERLLQDSGVCRFSAVAAQNEPDGRFPTVAFPNPEEPGAMDAVIELAREQGALLACANDPDADRLAVAARNEHGDYESLTGDQVGVLLGSWLLDRDYPFTPIVCASIVSSRMLERIATARGARYFETLTGFKWLANVALQHQDDKQRFLYAYEEALGYALGQVVRDKDGLSALLAFTLMAAELAAKGRSVLDELESLYRQHGLFLSAQRSIATRPGAASITDRLREAPPGTIGKREIRRSRDLASLTQVDADGSRESLDGHPADVLIYTLDDDSRVIVRPSGTEPKTKCYYEVVATVAPGEAYGDARRDAAQKLEQLVEHHQAQLGDLGVT